MPYPTITSIYRVQAIISGPSGLPTDQFINTWYFENEGAPTSREDYALRMCSLLDGFYGDAQGASTLAVRQFIPSGLGDITYKVYDIGEAPPRYPILDPVPATWSPADPNDVLPREVACCLSFKGGDGPRKKGRVYIGPLTVQAVAEDATDASTRVLGNLQQTLGEAASWLMTAGTDGTGPDVWWCQVSPTNADFNRVTEAWVDNAFDTQRSRGREPSARRRWTSAGEIV